MLYDKALMIIYLFTYLYIYLQVLFIFISQVHAMVAHLLKKEEMKQRVRDSGAIIKRVERDIDMFLQRIITTEFKPGWGFMTLRRNHSQQFGSFVDPRLLKRPGYSKVVGR
jgi:hypothetical protein